MLLFQIEIMTTAAKIERRVKAAPAGHVFTIGDFLAGASPAAVTTALSRLSKRGALDRVRRGVYHKPRTSRFGRGSAAPEFVALLASGGKAPGPAGASAAAALGLTTQIPPRASVAVVGNPPTAVPDVRFVKRSNVERVAARLRPAEVALLEVLRDDLKWVEIPDDAVRSRLHAMIAAGDIDPRRVRRAARREPRRVASGLERLLAA